MPSLWQRLQAIRSRRAWSRWERQWRQAVAWTRSEASSPFWGRTQAPFARLTRQAQRLAQQGYPMPALPPGRSERLPLPQGTHLEGHWSALLDAWTRARMDRVRPSWFWPLLLRAHDRPRIRALLDQGATHALVNDDIDAIRQVNWHGSMFQAGHWPHEAHDRHHRAWVAWLLHRGMTVAPESTWAYHWPQLWRWTAQAGMPNPWPEVERTIRRVLLENRRLGPADCEQLAPPRGPEGLLRWLDRMDRAHQSLQLEEDLLHLVRRTLTWGERIGVGGIFWTTAPTPDGEASRATQLGRLLGAWVRLQAQPLSPDAGMALIQELPRLYERLFKQPPMPFWEEWERSDSPLAPLREALADWPSAEAWPQVEFLLPQPWPPLFVRRHAQLRQDRLAARPATAPSRPRARS